MTKGEKIKNLRERLGISQTDMAAAIGVSKQTLYKYENDIITNIPSDKIEAIARASGTIPEYIMGWGSASQVIPSPGLLKIEKRSIPVLGKVACGEPVFADQVEYYDTEDAPINADFALIAEGDSMINARINDGDIVFIKQQPTVNNGEIAAVSIDSETTLKRFYYYAEAQMVQLLPENPNYKPLIYTGEELQKIKVLGRAIAFWSALK